MLRRAGFAQATRVLHYGLIVLTAWAAASVVVRLVGLDLHPKIQVATSTEQPAARLARNRHAADDEVILRRNLFGATDLEVPGEDAPAAAGSADLKLRGIAASEGASFAVFENTASGEQNVFRVGEKVFDGPKLVAVDATGAEVMLRGKRHRYEIEEEDTLETQASAKPARPGKVEKEKAGKSARYAKAEKPGKDAKKNSADSGGVRKTGEGAYLVDRHEVENVVSNLNEVITQARAIPVLNDGKSQGFRLISIRPGSIFDKLGLIDGDIVQRINDTELTDPSKAIGLLEEVQSVGQVHVSFVRSGKLHSYTYTIR